MHYMLAPINPFKKNKWGREKGGKTCVVLSETLDYKICCSNMKENGQIYFKLFQLLRILLSYKETDKL